MSEFQERRRVQIVRQNNDASALAGRGVDGSGGGPHDPDMEPRVAALETSMQDVKAALGRLEPLLVRIDERTNYLATKAEVAASRSDILQSLAGTATKGTVWVVGLTLASLVVAALAAGAVYMPYLAVLLRRAGQ